jgi:transketolase
MSLNTKLKLANKLLDSEKVERVPTRNGYGEGLVLAGDKDKNVVALCADLTESTRTEAFAKKYPERFIQVGIAEQSMAGVASGLAAIGKIPFISSYAMFSPGRNWEQIRTTICYNDQTVKIVGAHAGVSVGPDGATHQAIEDIAITRVLPNMVVIVPCDVTEARKATVAAAKTKQPTYLRFAREKSPVMTTSATPFKIGKADIFFDCKGKPDVAIVACGPLVYEALQAAHKLEQLKVKVCVINSHTIKPLDEKTIIKAAKDAGAIVTVEEHQIIGGLGSAVAELLAKKQPTPQEFIGINDRFGESGPPDTLITKFGLTAPYIVKAAQKVIKRKV